MVDKLASLCLMAGPLEMANGAAFYENLPGHAQTAVVLYHKVKLRLVTYHLAYHTHLSLSVIRISYDSRASWFLSFCSPSSIF